ncbi:MAG: peptidylprolyl isomerase [Pyrinomonadaceae bacterium MAG19_C2-C3]|nr:peptidylprolyl isomerase [Pyrinomonadaceae bacterium MAG19_C2-C3]
MNVDSVRVKKEACRKTMRKFRGALWLTALCLAVSVCAACGGDAANNTANNANTGQTADIKTNVKPEPDAEVAVIEMEDAAAYGRIVVELYPNIAPKMVEQFKTLIRQGAYDGTAFHRTSKALSIIQGGDPNSKDNDPANDGAGNSSLPNVPDEFSDLPFKRGTLGAANTGAPSSQNSQFFITLDEVPGFDERYTVFGQVIEGIGNAEIIMNAPTDPDASPERDGSTSRPLEPVRVKRITLQPRAIKN